MTGLKTAANVATTGLSPRLRALALRLLADELMAKYPSIEAVPHEPGRPLPPGARYLPGATLDDVEALDDRGELGAANGREDDDAVE